MPRPLRRDLPEFEIRTAVEMGWSGIKNGELLSRADGVFDVFLTADRNLPFQQNLSNFQFGVVVLAAGSTKLHDLRPLAPSISAALGAVQPGEVLWILPDG